MSVKAMAAVWDCPARDSDHPDGLSSSEKLVLLKYADHADHDGGSIFPGAATVAAKTGFSERGVQKITRRLIQNGYLELEKTGGGTRSDGRGIPNTYRLGPKVYPEHGSPYGPEATPNPEPPTPNAETPYPERGSGEPSENHQDNHQQRSISRPAQENRDLRLAAQELEIDLPESPSELGKMKKQAGGADGLFRLMHRMAGRKRADDRRYLWGMIKKESAQPPTPGALSDFLEDLGPRSERYDQAEALERLVEGASDAA